MKPTKQLQHTCNFYFYHDRRQNCLTFNDDFVNFIENYKNEHGESLKEKVQLCIFDPPFGWDIGDHDKMNDIELEKICNIAFHITKPGGTIIIFTGLNHIKKYNDKFKEQKLMVEYNGLVITHSLEHNFISFFIEVYFLHLIGNVFPALGIR